MKFKFWITYMTVTALGLVVVFFATARMEELPSILTTSQMQQLTGGLSLQSKCNSTEGCVELECDPEGAPIKTRSFNILRCYDYYDNHWCKDTRKDYPLNLPDNQKQKSCIVRVYDSNCDEEIFHRWTRVRPCTWGAGDPP